MSKKEYSPQEIATLAGALDRLLRRPGTEQRKSIGGSWRGDQGVTQYTGFPGSYSGNVSNLLENLCEDRVWFGTAARPHDKVSLRNQIKATSEYLHMHFGVVISLDGQKLTMVKHGR